MITLPRADKEGMRKSRWIQEVTTRQKQQDTVLAYVTVEGKSLSR